MCTLAQYCEALMQKQGNSFDGGEQKGATFPEHLQIHPAKRIWLLLQGSFPLLTQAEGVQMKLASPGASWVQEASLLLGQRPRWLLGAPFPGHKRPCRQHCLKLDLFITPTSKLRASLRLSQQSLLPRFSSCQGLSGSGVKSCPQGAQPENRQFERQTPAPSGCALLGPCLSLHPHWTVRRAERRNPPGPVVRAPHAAPPLHSRERCLRA